MEDPKYVEWCFGNLKHFELTKEAKELWRNRMLAIEAEEDEQDLSFPRTCPPKL